MNALEWERESLWRFRARLVRVVDADTIKILADCGYRGRHEPSLRLFGCWAPELGTAAGVAARQWLIEFLAANNALSPYWMMHVQTVQRETVVTETSSFERWVSVVHVIDPYGERINVADAIIAAGYATAERTG